MVREERMSSGEVIAEALSDPEDREWLLRELVRAFAARQDLTGSTIYYLALDALRRDEYEKLGEADD